MVSTVFFPGTFDPMTNGHLNVIEKATALFDRVVVGVAKDVLKQPQFSFEERLRLVTEVVQSLPTVSVVGFSGLTVAACAQASAQAILRGVRNHQDFDYEFQLAQVNRQLDPHLQTVFLMPDPAYLFVSASMVREIAKLGGDIQSFVPMAIQKAFQK